MAQINECRCTTLVHFLTIITLHFVGLLKLNSNIYLKTGNYQDSLSDAEAATKLQPSFLKAFVRGE